MSAFQKRVELLEKWHKKIETLDDLAEAFLDVWIEAEADTEESIINLLEERLTKAKDTNEAFGQITAMRIPVEFDQLEAITEAIIYAIKGEQK